MLCRSRSGPRGEAQFRCEGLSWVHIETSVGWADFFSKLTDYVDRILQRCIVYYDSTHPTYLVTICVRMDVAQIFVVGREEWELGPRQNSRQALLHSIRLATQWPDRREVKTQIFTHSWPQKSPISKSYLILHARIEQHAAVGMSSKCQTGIGKPFGTQILCRDSWRNDAILRILRILFDLKLGSQD